MPQSARNAIQNDKFILCILDDESQYQHECIKSFDCGDGDLNDFFRDDALAYKNQLLATTYFLQPIGAIESRSFAPMALVSLLNDSILITPEEKRGEKTGFWRQFKKILPYPKRFYPAYPAVKIGRLGVNKAIWRYGTGTALLNLLKEFFLTENRTGCRFLTVDAYNEDKTINFYRKNGFGFLYKKDSGEKTRTMYFDLMRFRRESAKNGTPAEVRFCYHNGHSLNNPTT